MTARSRSLNSLTGLRFIAAAMIVLRHIAGQFGSPPVILGGWPVTGGVSFFFILSGFILTHAHPNMTAGGTPLSFYVSRIAGIWPAHVACFLLWFILFKMSRKMAPADRSASHWQIFSSWRLGYLKRASFSVSMLLVGVYPRRCSFTRYFLFR
jgi:peptidoglycan/LPS O-acetylase OafA/YrhL